jgi:hypothetical protein
MANDTKGLIDCETLKPQTCPWNKWGSDVFSLDKESLSSYTHVNGQKCQRDARKKRSTWGNLDPSKRYEVQFQKDRQPHSDTNDPEQA